MALERHDPAAAAAVADEGWIDAPETQAAQDEAVETIEVPEGAVELTHANEPPRDPNGRFERPGLRSRGHNARSNQATAEDVPLIHELTRILRANESKLDPSKVATVSPRVQKLLTRIAATEAPADGAAAPERSAVPVAAAVTRPAAAPRRPIPAAPAAFTTPEPTFDDFKDAADPLTAYHRAITKWDRDKEQHGLAVKYHEQETTRAQGETQAAYDTEIKTLGDAHMTRLQAKVAADPAVKDLLAAHADTIVTGPMLEAILRSGDTSHDVMIALLQDARMLDELALATYNQPATPDLVALVQRRLKTLGTAQAADRTGSAAVPAPKPAPRPPNPVRTAPEAPPKEMPGDDASWEDHAAAFHKPQRSRIRRG